MRAMLCLALVLLVSGSAAATGTLEAGPIALTLDNGHEGCGLDVCPVGISGERGDTFVDANQDVRSVRAEVDAGAVNDLAGEDTLDDREVAADLREGLAVDNPFYPEAFSLVRGGTRGPGPLGSFGYSWYEDDHLRIYYLGPELRPLGLPLGQRTILVPLSDLGWQEEIVISNELGNNTHDDFWGDGPLRCDFMPIEGCENTQGTVWGTYLDNSPNVGYGLSIWRASMIVEG